VNDLKVETVKIKDLILDPRNVRTHSDRNLQTIANSLKEFGQRRPLVVWDDTVIAGNGTMMAAQSLGWNTVQVTRVPAEWTEDQARAYAIADNRTAELADWDGPQLLLALTELPESLLSTTGFSGDDLLDLDKVWGEPTDLDALHDEIGDPTEDDDMIPVRFVLPPDVHEKWLTALAATEAKDLEAIILVVQAAFDALTDGSI